MSLSGQLARCKKCKHLVAIQSDGYEATCPNCGAEMRMPDPLAGYGYSDDAGSE